MSHNLPVAFRFIVKVFFFALSSSIVLVACGSGGKNNEAPPITPPADPPASIRDVQANFEAEPMRGIVYYYCDCGNGAEIDCAVGNDDNVGTSAGSPRRRIANAMSRLNSLSGTNTVALCKGGAFDAQARLNIDNSGCSTGSTCTDLREYTPTTFAGSAKPVINAAPGTNLFFAAGASRGGLRIMNLALRGNGSQSNENRAFFLYNGAHDIKAYNLDISGFYFTATSQEGPSGESINNEFIGNNFYSNYRIAFFGGGSGTKVNYNYIRTTGSSAGLDHAIYIASGDIISYDVEIIGNDIQGQYGATCLGGIISNHGAVDRFKVKDNLIVLDAKQTSGGCWGISSNNNTDATEALFYRNSVYSGNTIINAGNTALTVTSSPNVVIENNLIINDWSGAGVGISITGTKRALYADDVSNANVIRNNTIWYGSNVTGETRGISVGAIAGEGTGHIISNNTVSSIQNAGTLNCYRHDLPLTSYAFANNNHCHATGSYNFEYSRGTLGDWQKHAAGFDTESKEDDPQFTATGSDYLADFFKPLSGSPLIGAGSSTAGYKSTTDFAGQPRPNPPAIGAYEP